MPESNEYFTGTDATITLLTHPDDKWRGESVDCAFFQLTAGTSPIHIWNYARSEGTPAMSNAAQDAQIEELQSGTAGGAPFDDTAVSNMQASLQLLINEERFESTYYQFRSMSEIGNVKVEYDTQVDFESRSSTGYVMLGGRVSTVSRESSGRNATYPSVEITFRDVRPIGQTIALDTSEFAPSGRQRGGPGVSQELQAQGLGRREGQSSSSDRSSSPDPSSSSDPAFTVRVFEGRAHGRKARKSFDNIPSTLEVFDDLTKLSENTITGNVKDWVGSKSYDGPVLAIKSRQQGRLVYLWDQSKNEYRQTATDFTELNRLLQGAGSGGAKANGHVSSSGIGAIKGFESFRPEWYEDSAGYWTIGHGLRSSTLDSLGITKDGQAFTYANFPGAAVTRSQSTRWVRMDVEERESSVESALTRPALQHEFDAMISLAYNIGTGKFESSNLVDLFNAGDKRGAGNEFLVWNKSGGSLSEGLNNRREAERRIFLFEDYSLEYFT